LDLAARTFSPFASNLPLPLPELTLLERDDRRFRDSKAEPQGLNLQATVASNAPAAIP